MPSLIFFFMAAHSAFLAISSENSGWSIALGVTAAVLFVASIVVPDRR